MDTLLETPGTACLRWSLLVSSETGPAEQVGGLLFLMKYYGNELCLKIDDNDVFMHCSHVRYFGAHVGWCSIGHYAKLPVSADLISTVRIITTFPIPTADPLPLALQVLCNDMMGSVFISAEEIRRESVQLRAIMLTVLARWVGP